MKQYSKPIGKTLGFILLYLIVNVIITVVLFIALGVEDPAEVSANNITLTLLATQVIIFLGILIIYQPGFVRHMRFKKVKPYVLFWALIVGFAGINISVLLIHFVEFLFPEAVQSYIEAIEASIGGADLWLSFLAVALMAPLVEEIAFRGMFFRWFEKTNMRPWVIILLSGLFFGLFHLNIVQGVFASAIGIIYALGFYWTKSIWVPIAMHFGNNAFASLSVLIPEAVFEETWFIVLSYGLILLVPIGLWQIKKTVGQVDDDRDEYQPIKYTLDEEEA